MTITIKKVGTTFDVRWYEGGHLVHHVAKTIDDARAVAISQQAKAGGPDKANIVES